MQVKVAEDVDAPINVVWQHFTEFEGFEAEARSRGVELTRVGNWSAAGAGSEWQGSASIRGKKRKITSKITRMVEDDVCEIDSQIGGMDCRYEMTFVSLAPAVTRVAITLDLSARTLTARLFLQTMKLARNRITQRLQSVLARQGNAAEAAYRLGDG